MKKGFGITTLNYAPHQKRWKPEKKNEHTQSNQNEIKFTTQKAKHMVKMLLLSDIIPISFVMHPIIHNNVTATALQIPRNWVHEMLKMIIIIFTF